MSPALTRRLKVGIEIPSSAAPSRVFNKGSFCRSMLSTERFSIHSNGELGNGRALINLHNMLLRNVQEYDSFSRFVQALLPLSFLALTTRERRAIYFRFLALITRNCFATRG